MGEKADVRKVESEYFFKFLCYQDPEPCFELGRGTEWVGRYRDWLLP